VDTGTLGEIVQIDHKRRIKDLNFLLKNIKEFARLVGFIIVYQLFFLSFMHLFALLLSNNILEYFNIYVEESI
jgi:hypothetical protein